MLSWSRKGITKSGTCPRTNLTTANLSLHLPILTTYANVLSVILVSYHFILLLHRGSTVLPASKGYGARHSRAWSRPATPDPRPLNHLPQLARNSVLFSLLSSFFLIYFPLSSLSLICPLFFHILRKETTASSTRLIEMCGKIFRVFWQESGKNQFQCWCHWLPMTLAIFGFLFAYIKIKSV